MEQTGYAKAVSRRSFVPAALTILVVLAAMLITWPFAEIGVIDDFSYVKTAQIYAQTGHFVYNEWSTALLGWQVPAGAAGIRLFGFSFTAERLYTFPLTLLGVLLFFRILRNFGLTDRNAVFGTLMLFLAPIVLPLAAVSMTDVPGLVVALLCVYLCQQAVFARTPAATIAWLCAATASNVAGGTVRQIAWLGALAAVPATAFVLRRRRGVLAAGVALWVLTVAGIEYTMHWYARHPYTLKERIFKSIGIRHPIAHTFSQMFRGSLTLTLLLVPVLLAFAVLALRGGTHVNTRARVRIGVAAAATLALFVALTHLGKAATWLMPFSPTVIDSLGVSSPTLPEMLGLTVNLSTWLRVVVSALTLTAAYGYVEVLIAGRQTARDRRFARTTHTSHASFDEDYEAHSAAGVIDGRTMLWMMVPFFIVNILFLLPRAQGGMLFDRYLMTPLALAILLLLHQWQRLAARPLPRLAVAALAVFSVFSMVGTHDVFSLYRARAAAGSEVTGAGVPRTNLQGGFEYDGWTQIEATGVMDNDHVGVTVMPVPEECGDWFSGTTSAVNPRYFVMRSAVSCYEPSRFADVPYRTWMPPTHRVLHVWQLKEPYRSETYITKKAAAEPAP